MAISFDPRDLETLRQVRFLLDFLKEPEKFKDIAERGAKTAEELNAAVNAYTTVAEANKYLEKARASIADADAAVATATAEQLEVKEETLRISQAAQEKIEQDTAALIEQKRIMQQEQELLTATRISLEEQEVAIRLLKQQVEDREQKLAAAELVQRNRAAQIAALAAA